MWNACQVVSPDTVLSVKELATAVSMKMDLTILILNDDAYGMIKWKQVPASACAPVHRDDLGQWHTT